MAKYHGHKNWNHWNVSLWLNNDKTLYDHMKRAIKTAPNRDTAASLLLTMFAQNGNRRTPEGAPYSKSAIRAAMVGVDYSECH